jgi:zinc/manganese transport system substrate-binding protein
MQKLVTAISDELSTLSPDAAATFAANAATLTSQLQALETRASALADTVAGAGVAITEPVPMYLLSASGFTNVTPEAFSEAIEEGTDVSPTVLQQTLDIFADGTATALVYNEQTTGPETEKVLAAAENNGVAVVPVTETMPADSDYVGWMGDNLTALEAAVK